MNQICKVKDRCGACTYIGEDYTESLKKKHDYVKSLYPKYKVEPVIGMENPYHYRHKVYATFSSDKKGMVYAGMYEEESHRVVASKNCLIQHPSANRIITTMCKLATKMHIEAFDDRNGHGVLRHAYIRVSHKTGKILLTIVIGKKVLPGSKEFIARLLEENPDIETIILNWNDKHTSMILGDREKVIYGKGYIDDELCGFKFRIGSKSFYQVNPVQTEVLYQTALGLANIQKDEEVLDACCGIGTISLLAASKAKEVVGVEINENAIRDAIFNAKANGISNAYFYADDATNFLGRLLDKPDVVLLDPPRSGMSKEFMESLAEMGPKKVVYISCNPKTQARDIKNLTCRGYRVKKIVPVDMFCFTDHIETIVLLTKN